MPGSEHPVHDGAAERRHHAEADEDDGRHQLEHTERQTCEEDGHVRDINAVADMNNGIYNVYCVIVRLLYKYNLFCVIMCCVSKYKLHQTETLRKQRYLLLRIHNMCSNGNNNNMPT